MPQGYIPNKPPIESDVTGFIFKEWFMTVWRWIQGNTNGKWLTIAPGTNTQMTLDNLSYMINVGALGAVCSLTLPSAATCIGKRFEVYRYDALATVFGVAPLGTDIIGNDTGVIAAAVGKCFTSVGQNPAVAGQYVWIVTSRY